MQFQIVLEMNWGDPSVSINYPPDCHTGNLFLINHNLGYNLFNLASFASPGIVETAEYGTTNALEQEARESSYTGNYYTSGILQSPGLKFFTIDVDPKFPYLSFVTMLAPSQCNFTGLTNIDLRNVTNARFPLFIYSAGSAVDDVFETFPKKHLARRVPIRLKTDLPFFYPADEIAPAGYLHVNRI